jgi:hypothetical protein
MKIFSQGSRSPDRDLNPVSLECEAEVLISRSQILVFLSVEFILPQKVCPCS